MQTLIGEVFCVHFAVGASRTEQSDIEDAWGVCYQGDWRNHFEKRTRLLLRAMNGMAFYTMTSWVELRLTSIGEFPSEQWMLPVRG